MRWGFNTILCLFLAFRTFISKCAYFIWWIITIIQKYQRRATFGSESFITVEIRIFCSICWISVFQTLNVDKISMVDLLTLGNSNTLRTKRVNFWRSTLNKDMIPSHMRPLPSHWDRTMFPRAPLPTPLTLFEGEEQTDPLGSREDEISNCFTLKMSFPSF